MSSPFAIAVSPTGARRTRADHPNLPMTPDEIAQASARCLDVGACLLHLHVRKSSGIHSLEIADYRLAIDAVGRAVGKWLVIQITTEAVGQYSPAQQIHLVKSLKPEAASIALREIIRSEEDVSSSAAFFGWMHQEHVVPQFILYSTVDIEYYFKLRERGVIPDDRHWVLFVLGQYNMDRNPSPADLLPFLGSWRDTAIPWAVCAFGRSEAACVTAALTLGGHARVGFENNLHLPNGSLASDNQELVAGVAQIARSLGHPLADADTLRAWFHQNR